MLTLLKPTLAGLSLACMLVIAGCGGGEDAEETTVADAGQDSTAAMTTTRMAWAQLQPKSGSDVTGEVQFTETEDGVLVVATVEGLAEGKHGIHIHETGDCSAPDASSAGGHFSPQDDPHGAPEDPAGERHLGDLGNLTADASGAASFQRTDEQLTLTGQHSIIDQAVVVHAEPDDLTSQPSGSAGARVACGVISWANSSGDAEDRTAETTR